MNKSTHRNHKVLVFLMLWSLLLAPVQSRAQQYQYVYQGTGASAQWAPGGASLNSVINPTMLNGFRRGLASVKSGTGICKVLVVGDSISRGTIWAGAPYTNTLSWPARLRQEMGTILPCTEGVICPWGAVTLSATTSKDPRYTLGTGWNYNTSPIGGGSNANGFNESGDVQGANSATGNLSLAPGCVIDTIIVYYYQQSGGGTFTLNVDGGSSLGTINTSNSTIHAAQQTFTVTRGIHTVNVPPPTVGTVDIAGFECYDSTVPSIHVTNASVSGGTTGTCINSNNFDGGMSEGQWQPDLTIVILGANDAGDNVSTSTFISNYTSILNHYAPSGDVIIGTCQNFAPGARETNYAAYVPLLQGLAASYPCGLVDVNSRQGSYTLLNSLGFIYSDGLHPTSTGSADMADAFMMALTGTSAGCSTIPNGLNANATNGVLCQTAPNTFAGETITGTASHVTVSNGDGIAGPPTVDLATDTALPGNPTATTQGPSDNSTRVATTAYVTSAVAGVSGGGLSSALSQDYIYQGNASNIATPYPITGDVTMSGGVTAIKNSVTLSGSPTTTTQTSGDASNAVATDAFVANAIAGIGVGSGFGGNGSNGAVVWGTGSHSVGQTNATTFAQTAATTATVESGYVMDSTSAANYSGTTSISSLGNGRTCAGPQVGSASLAPAIGSTGGTGGELSSVVGQGGGGGGYGGAGGAGGSTANSTTVAIPQGGLAASIKEVDAGGAGGAGGGDATNRGGGGGAKGGSYRHLAAGSITISGSVAANGSNGNNGTAGQAGGGGGGAGGYQGWYSLVSITVQSGANVSCNGGNGGSAAGSSGYVGGGGGGGRMVFIAPSVILTATPTCSAGNKGTTGLTTNAANGSAGIITNLSGTTPNFPIIAMVEEGRLDNLCWLRKYQARSPNDIVSIDPREAINFMASSVSRNNREFDSICSDLRNGGAVEEDGREGVKTVEFIYIGDAEYQFNLVVIA